MQSTFLGVYRIKRRVEKFLRKDPVSGLGNPQSKRCSFAIAGLWLTPYTHPVGRVIQNREHSDRVAWNELIPANCTCRRPRGRRFGIIRPTSAFEHLEPETARSPGAISHSATQSLPGCINSIFQTPNSASESATTQNNRGDTYCVILRQI